MINLGRPQKPQWVPRYQKHREVWETYGKSDLQLDYKIDSKSIFEPKTGLRHYFSWIRLFFMQIHAVDSSFGLVKARFMTILVVRKFRITSKNRDKKQISNIKNCDC